MKLLIATRNPDKQAELERLLQGMPVEVLTLDDVPGVPEVVEDAETLEGNAAKKASETARACGMHAVADDSGLFVDALGGRPGVRSSRYAGPEPTTDKLCRKLLGEMEGVPGAQRGAHFRCEIALAGPTGEVVLAASGRCDGVIGEGMRGQGGFGYDPVFLHEGGPRTFAEMTPEQKNAVSHRGRALRDFRRRFDEWLRGGTA